MDRLTNLLGAQALALTDLLSAADPDGVQGAAGAASASERSALVTLLAHPDRPTSWLGQVLGLTSSGSTRLVDRLASAGWVERSPGADARSRRLALTDAGRARAEGVLAARRAALAGTVRDLSASECRELERLLGRLVGGLTDDRVAANRVCRLCDRGACASQGSACPLASARAGDGSASA